MIRAAIAWEWTRLRTTRTTWLLAGLSLACTFAVGAALAALARQVAADGTPVLPVEAATVVLTRSPVTPLVAGILGVLAMAGEFRHGTAAGFLLTVPRRGAAFAGKALAVAGAAAALAVANLAVGWLAVVLFLPGPVPVAALTGVQLGQVVLVAGWSLIGLALAALVRSQTASVVILLAEAYIVEPGLRMGLQATQGWTHHLADYLPFTVGAGLVSPPADAIGALTSAPALPAGVAAAVFVAIVATVVGASAARFRRVDI